MILAFLAGEETDVDSSGEGCATLSGSASDASASVVKAMAAAIQPSKSVPPQDIVKKRKRDRDLKDDMLSQSSKELSQLASTINKAVEQLAVPTPPAPKMHPNVSPDVEALLGSVVVAFSRVPQDHQITCVMELLKVINTFISK